MKNTTPATEPLWAFPQPTNRHPERIHIYSEATDKLLCGTGITGYGGGTNYVDKKWLRQADPDQAVCLLCRRIAERMELPEEIPDLSIP